MGIRSPLILFCLLLCLSLAACGEEPVILRPLPEVTLPTLGPEDAQPLPTDPYLQGVAQERLRRAPPTLEAAAGGWLVRGPAGTVPAYQEAGDLHDPVTADVDGDGLEELIYLCPGASTGFHTDCVCVYGLEEGLPILEQRTVLKVPQGTSRLEVNGNDVLYVWREAENATDRAGLAAASLSYGRLHDGLPTGIYLWSEELPVFGASFTALRERGEHLLREITDCAIWREEIAAGDGTRTRLQAAVTANGVTVTGCLAWTEQPNGTWICSGLGMEAAAPVEEPEVLLGRTERELEALLGPAHVQDGVCRCWFTEDAKLLRVELLETAETVEVWDLITGDAWIVLSD